MEVNGMLMLMLMLIASSQTEKKLSGDAFSFFR
jgi:hypothetical protein